MTWGDIPVLWLLTIVPILVVAYALDGQRRRRLLERIGHHQMIARMTATFSPARRRWRAVLSVAAVALLVLALARPQIPGRAKLTESRGLDLVVALDFSKSMLARDIYPTRLDRAKAELGRFIDSLKGDRVGLVAFAGETMAYPLTVDYEAAKLFWRDLTPDDMPVGGTDLGKAITVATEELKDVRAREGKKRPAQVILLITDGEDTEGKGIEAARKAAALGIKIFTLGIGSNEKPPVPLFDEDGKQHGYVTDEGGEPVRVGIDAASLQQMAALTGGEYVSLDPRRFGVDRVQKAIANLERTEEAARFEREPDDVGRGFLVPAFLVLASAACVRERRRRRSSVLRSPSVEAANAGGASEPSQRILAAMILILVWPLLSGFDILKRKDPNIEEGNRQLQAGKADKALEAYDRAVQALPEEPVAHFDRGVALYQLGKFPEAQKEFQRASEGHDASVKADAYYNMGNSWLKQERYKEALDAYKHTLGLRPDDRRAKWNLELALRKLQEQKQQQQSQSQKQDDKKQDQQQQQQQQQSQQDQQKQQQDQQQQQQQQQEQQKQQEQKQQEQQQQQAQGDQQKQQQQPSPGDKEKQEREKQEREKQAQARAKKAEPREIDKQDAEAVLDALERVEPTVQKDLARHRAGNRRPAKDW